MIFTDATADLTDELMAGLPKVEVLPMNVMVEDQEFLYGPGGNITSHEFYQMLRAGKFASTSQVTPATYISCFEPVLQSGKDILYLCFSSGLSGTFQSAQMSAYTLAQEYPDRKIICIDTLAASVGEGFLVREAAKMQQEGLTIEELAEWVKRNRLKVCHWFTVDTFTHLKHGGRVSATAAAFGTVLNIKPLLHVDNEGKLIAMEKCRGQRKAVEAQFDRIVTGWCPEMGNRVLIGHGDALETAKMLKGRIMERWPTADVQITDIGPVIGAHTGPGVIALFYWGRNR